MSWLFVRGYITSILQLCTTLCLMHLPFVLLWKQGSCGNFIVLQAKAYGLMCRLKVYKAFKEGQKRILVATDLVGRGIDIERVNIVINYDMPETDERHGNGADTYLHRVTTCFLLGP